MTVRNLLDIRQSITGPVFHYPPGIGNLQTSFPALT